MHREQASLVGLSVSNSFGLTFLLPQGGALTEVSAGSTTPAANVSVSFPPGQFPPTSKYDYEVPNANPRMKLMFYGYEVNPQITPSSARAALNLAIRSTGPPKRRDRYVQQPHYNYVGGGASSRVVIDFTTEDQGVTVPITWGILNDAFGGLRSFVFAYPGITFAYQVTLYNYGGRDQVVCADGTLLPDASDPSELGLTGTQ